LNSQLTLSTVYLKEYLYTVDTNDTSLLPFQVLFKALSKRQLEYIRSFESVKRNELNIIVLQKSLIKFFNVKDVNNNIISEPNIELLTFTQRETLANIILKVSIVTEEIIQKIYLNVNLSLDDKFKTNTWDCKVCQEKGLDKQRNCKFRADYDKLFVSDLDIMVGDTKYNHCPMYYRDYNLLSDIYSCYNALDKGLLPEIGGTIDQTEFFYYATEIVRKTINDKYEKESKE